MRLTVAAMICVILLAAGANARETHFPQEATDAAATVEPAQDEPSWSFSASAYAYFIPEDSDYLQPNFIADHRWLHLEARYNYEDLETGSVWGGYNFRVGKEVSFEITPMLGGVLGKTTGIAPGYRGAFTWWWLELYSEGEYVFDTQEREDSFFYSWSELTLSPVDRLHGGFVEQRTWTSEGGSETQPGFLVGLTLEPVSVTGHLFNPGQSRPTYVISVGVDF